MVRLLLAGEVLAAHQEDCPIRQADPSAEWQLREGWLPGEPKVLAEGAHRNHHTERLLDALDFLLAHRGPLALVKDGLAAALARADLHGLGGMTVAGQAVETDLRGRNRVLSWEQALAQANSGDLEASHSSVIIEAVDLQERYRKLEEAFDLPVLGTDAIRADCLLAFDYEYPGSDAEIDVSTDEFTAVCPWTGLPDQGTLSVTYVPDRRCIELKALKYYLLSYRSVGIVQEHAANRILEDLVKACEPVRMTVVLDYQTRGGIHTVVTVRHARPE